MFRGIIGELRLGLVGGLTCFGISSVDYASLIHPTFETWAIVGWISEA